MQKMGFQKWLFWGIKMVANKYVFEFKSKVIFGIMTKQPKRLGSLMIDNSLHVYKDTQRYVYS
jgi:hypothetical protein